MMRFPMKLAIWGKLICHLVEVKIMQMETGDVSFLKTMNKKNMAKHDTCNHNKQHNAFYVNY